MTFFSGTVLESGRWPSSQERADRPSKRIHTSCVDSDSEHKRLKSEDSFERDMMLAVHLGDTSSTRQQRLASTTSRKKAVGLGDACGSQLLRRLVSQTPDVASRVYNGNASSAFNGLGGEHRSDTPERIRALDSIMDLAKVEGDHGGGGGGGGQCRRVDGGGDDSDGLDKIDVNRRNPSCGARSSVLMNLLVSGCDVSAGYICLAKPKPVKSIASA